MTRPTLLLVDDDPEDLGALGAFMVQMGFEAIAACNAREALHHLVSAASPPVAIIVDIGLPDMNGLDLIRVIRAYRRLADIPILVVTGHDRKRIFETERIAGFFQKPIDCDALLATVRSNVTAQ